MIAVSSSSRSFASLGRYLVVGRDKVEEGRVAWSSARNLPTNDPELAAKIMRATASQNVRVSQPVYHIALSFDPGDIVDRKSMERVADSVLKELKLEQHQAVMVAHSDRSHPHLHILINRIHPETGRAWDRWQDYGTIQRVLREEERALNLRGVQASVDVTSQHGRVVESGTIATEHPGPSAQRSTTSETRASKIENDFDALDVAKAANEQRFAAERNVAATESRLVQLEAALARVEQARKPFESALARAYVEPERAADAFLRCAEREGERVAAARMRENPAEFGKLISVGGDGRLWRRQGVDDVEARGAAREAAGYGATLAAARREIPRLAQAELQTPSLAVALSPTGAHVRDHLKSQLEAAHSHLRALRSAEQGSAATVERLELRLGQVLRKLSPPEFERLRAVLSPERFSLAGKLRRMARDAVIGRDVDD